jgi:predicted nucleic acid-binding protein
MRIACVTLFRMSKLIQIRNVPDELHRTLKARAAKAGMTLSDYLLYEKRGSELLEDLTSMRLNRYPHTALLRRMWELGENVTIQDAAYIALAETLDAPLVTMDGRLARAPGIRAEVEVYE